MADNTPEQICVWCCKPAAPATRRTRGEIVVCLNCYYLLINAGISNDEIFAQKTPAEDGAPSKTEERRH